MRQLFDAKATWERSGEITIKWDPSKMGCDQYIIFAQVVSLPSGFAFSNPVVMDLKFEMNNSSKTLKPSVSDLGVHKVTYVAFSTPEKRWDEQEIRNACSSNSGFLITAMAGHADITYKINVANTAGSSVVTISLDCSSAIEGGMLGYRYFCGVPILQAVPGLKQGTTELPPIIIPKDSTVEVVPYRQEFAENLHIQEKKKKFGLF